MNAPCNLVNVSLWSDHHRKNCWKRNIWQISVHWKYITSIKLKHMKLDAFARWVVLSCLHQSAFPHCVLTAAIPFQSKYVQVTKSFFKLCAVALVTRLPAKANLSLMCFNPHYHLIIWEVEARLNWMGGGAGFLECYRVYCQHMIVFVFVFIFVFVFVFLVVFVFIFY